MKREPRPASVESASHDLLVSADPSDMSLGRGIESPSAISMGLPALSQSSPVALSVVKSATYRGIMGSAALTPPVLSVAPWSDDAVLFAYLSGAGSRIVREIRHIATCAMLSSRDVFVVPTVSCSPGSNEAVENGPSWPWLCQLRPTDERVPCPPVRLTETLRVFPPAWEAAWDDTEPLESSEIAFLFAKDH